MPYIIYANLESLTEKIDEFANNQGKSLTKKIDEFANNQGKSLTIKTGEHVLSRYSMSTILVFDNIENKYSIYREEDRMKKFCSSLREHATNVFTFEKKEMLSLTERELKLHQSLRVCCICKEKTYKSLI